MSSEILTIAIPLLAIIVTLLSIAGLWYWWSGRKEEEPETGEAVGAEAKQQAVHTAAYPTGHRPADEGVIEVMRVLRDLADGSLIVEIDGRRYRNLTEITDGQVGRRFLGNAQALARFARLGEVEIPASWSQVEVPPPAPVTTRPPAASPVSAGTARDAAQQAGAAASASGGQPQQRGGKGKQEAEEKPAAPLTIADQIEELLQQRLLRTPALAYRSIHILPTLDGGVQIEVDGRYYDSVGEVADPVVREFIQATIREWEEAQ